MNKCQTLILDNGKINTKFLNVAYRLKCFHTNNYNVLSYPMNKLLGTSVKKLFEEMKLLSMLEANNNIMLYETPSGIIQIIKQNTLQSKLFVYLMQSNIKIKPKSIVINNFDKLKPYQMSVIYTKMSILGEYLKIENLMKNTLKYMFVYFLYQLALDPDIDPTENIIFPKYRSYYDIIVKYIIRMRRTSNMHKIVANLYALLYKHDKHKVLNIYVKQSITNMKKTLQVIQNSNKFKFFIKNKYNKLVTPLELKKFEYRYNPYINRDILLNVNKFRTQLKLDEIEP
jgi:hypothetical protein